MIARRPARAGVADAVGRCQPEASTRVVVNLQPPTLQPPRIARQKDEIFIMSTGQQHHIEHNALSFEAVNAHVDRINLAEVTAPTAVPRSGADRISRLATAYTAARPTLSVLAATPLIPTTWRAIVATSSSHWTRSPASRRGRTSPSEMATRPRSARWNRSSRRERTHHTTKGERHDHHR
jgi:hypothetical protein